MWDAFKGKIYLDMDRSQVNYQASLIQVQGNIFGQLYNILINTKITHNFISLVVVASVS
jgi:hypothetical protein